MNSPGAMARSRPSRMWFPPSTTCRSRTTTLELGMAPGAGAAVEPDGELATDGELVAMVVEPLAQPLTAPAAMPRTNHRPDTR